jgi:hypothetical protein
VLADAEALWQRAFEAAFDIGDAVCRPIWPDEPPSPVRLLYDVIVPDLLAAIYSMEDPVPVARLAESVWDAVRAHFDVDSLSPLSQSGLRGRVDNDLEHIFDAFEALGAVTSTRGGPSASMRCRIARVRRSRGDRHLEGRSRRHAASAGAGGP